jgi:hypothetical protein
VCKFGSGGSEEIKLFEAVAALFLFLSYGLARDWWQIRIAAELLTPTADA